MYDEALATKLLSRLRKKVKLREKSLYERYIDQGYDEVTIAATLKGLTREKLLERSLCPSSGKYIITLYDEMGN